MPGQRAPLRRLLLDQEAELGLLHRRLAVAVADAVRRHAVPTPDGPRITPAARVAILRETDRALDAIYGTRRGDPQAPLTRLIVANAHRARLLPVGWAVRQLRRRLRRWPEVLRAMGDQP